MEDPSQKKLLTLLWIITTHLSSRHKFMNAKTGVPASLKMFIMRLLTKRCWQKTKELTRRRTLTSQSSYETSAERVFSVCLWVSLFYLAYLEANYITKDTN